MQVKEVLIGDVKRVVDIHQDSFKGFFLTTLGPKFLQSYYKILLKDKGATFIGCYIDNQLQGFCSVANSAKGFNKRLIKANILTFITALFPIFCYKNRLSLAIVPEKLLNLKEIRRHNHVNYVYFYQNFCLLFQRIIERSLLIY